MSIQAIDPSVRYPQSGVIPFRMVDGDIQILLITTNSRKHWTIPKGLIEDGMSAAESAVHEAYEEAGIRGELHEISVGRYQYHKWGGTCDVAVFLMAVTRLLDHWPEAYFRERVWCSIDDARQMVKHKGLSDMIGQIESVIPKMSTRSANGQSNAVE
ncbi:MAG: NUDIX hydrolase [Desulfobacterales bacterium]|nr:NUDIX hydrolase [Desulfobacterales bacterium]